MKNLVNISNELMENIATYMDDELREQTHYAVAPCSNEAFITEYYNNATPTLKSALEDILSDEFGLDIDDIIYTAYYQVYNNVSLTQEEFRGLCDDFNIINSFPTHSRYTHKNEKVYTVMMASGDLIVFVKEEQDMLNTPYLMMIRASIRTALKMRLNYYEFNWYLLGSKNGYRYIEKLPSQEEILYADRLIDKVSESLLKRKEV